MYEYIKRNNIINIRYSNVIYVFLYKKPSEDLVPRVSYFELKKGNF